MEEKTLQKSRKGVTNVTSVSVSPTFQRLIDEYHLSPTEVYRRGVGVMLFDMGISPYSRSKINSKRSSYVKKFLKGIDEDEGTIREDRAIQRSSLNFRQIKKFNGESQ